MKQLTYLISALFFLTLGVSHVWALPNCVGPWSATTWDNCFGTYTYADGTKYVGAWKDGETNGQGTTTFTSGSKYVGEQKNGKRNGQGTFTYVNGEKYVGEFKNGIMHGQGTYTYANGRKDVGTFENNKLNGYAIRYRANGSIDQEGIFKNDKFWSAQKKSKVDKSNLSLLKTVYTMLPAEKRRKVQLNLKDLGLYKFSVDGFYGKGTENALTEYNKKNLNNVDLTNSENAVNLITTVLKLKPSSVGVLPNCPPSGLRNNCFGTQVWSSGNKYIGEYKDGKRSGWGTFTFGPNSEWAGDKYVGNWENDKSHGQGTYAHASGERYVGEFKNDYKHGQGINTFADGSEYVGEYKHNKKHGQGVLTSADGDKYVGEYKDNKRHGQGTYTFADGEKHIGSWENNKINGYAVIYLADGSINQEGIFKDNRFLYAQKKSKVDKSNLSLLKTVYTMLTAVERRKVQSNLKNLGFYKFSVDGFYGTGTANALTEYNKQSLNNADLTKSENVVKLITTVSKLNSSSVGALPNCSFDKSAYWNNCQGTATFANGDKYVGEYKEGKRSGQGTYYYLADNQFKGDKYVGEWEDDKTHGQGTYIYSNGDKYVGEFKESINGQGTKTYANGDKYVGAWKDDKTHGQGTYIYSNGNKYVGEHKDSMANGEGTLTFANGNKYLGKWKNDKPNGQGIFYFLADNGSNGDKYVGEFKDGWYYDQGTYIFADGRKKVGFWENNKLNGNAITYYADGSINQEGIFKDDKFLNAQKKSNIDKHKDFCEEIGFTPKTEGFGNCVLKLMDKD